MKSIFSICKIFFLCFFILGLFSSCHSYLMVDGKQVQKNVTIYVSGYTPGNGKLNLNIDNASGPSAEILDGSPGQHIRWKLDDPRHHKIDSLYEKPAHHNPVFEKDPHPVFLSKSWKGIIKDPKALQATALKDGKGKTIYEYNIDWDDGGSRHTDDPKIQINVIF